MISRISIFPTRLRPIFYATNTSIIIIDFVNERLINFNKPILSVEDGRFPTSSKIHRDDNIISINIRRKKTVSHSFDIHLEIPMIKSLLKQSLSKSSKSESTNKIEYNDGSAKIINWEDIYVDIWEAGRLTLTHYKRMTGIFITHDKLRLIKLHPRTNDSSGLYKKYFCLQYSNCLSIGSIRNNKLDVKNITHPLFGHIHRFCLREDNILMLVILKCYRVGYHQQLIFVDCNKIKLIGSIDLDKNIAPPTTPAHIFTELTSTRKDYLLLQSKFTPSITPFLLPPLASIVFSYLFADIPQ